MNKKLSIHDIAKQLNVSSATVSFVLNGKAAEKGISSAVEKKVLNHAKKIGYRPNMVAKSLRTGKSKIIGMLVEGIADPFFASIARGVERIAYQLDYKIFYASTENDEAIARKLIGAFRDAQVDGYIIAPPPGIEKDIEQLQNDNFPVVLFDRYFTNLPTHNVIVDNFNGTYQATRHFLQNGCRNIGFITLQSAQTQMNDRLNGYIKAVGEYGLKTHISQLPFGRGKEEVTEICHFLESNLPDAVLFATNYLAISGLEAIYALKLRIPDDIAVIAFDDNTHFSLFSPSITAVSQPVHAISEQVIRQLMSCLTDKEKIAEKETIVLPAELVVRESSVAAKRKNGLTPGHTVNQRALRK